MIIAKKCAIVKQKENKFTNEKGVVSMANLDNLTEEERNIVLARREYQRRWREANKDKVKAHNKRFYEKQVEKFSTVSTDKQRTESD